MKDVACAGNMINLIQLGEREVNVRGLILSSPYPNLSKERTVNSRTLNSCDLPEGTLNVFPWQPDFE